MRNNFILHANNVQIGKDVSESHNEKVSEKLAWKKKYFTSEVESDFSVKMMPDFICGREEREK